MIDYNNAFKCDSLHRTWAVAIVQDRKKTFACQILSSTYRYDCKASSINSCISNNIQFYYFRGFKFISHQCLDWKCFEMLNPFTDKAALFGKRHPDSLVPFIEKGLTWAWLPHKQPMKRGHSSKRGGALAGNPNTQWLVAGRGGGA